MRWLNRSFLTLGVALSLFIATVWIASYWRQLRLGHLGTPTPDGTGNYQRFGQDIFVASGVSTSRSTRRRSRPIWRR
jgi:hypothetical protein